MNKYIIDKYLNTLYLKSKNDLKSGYSYKIVSAILGLDKATSQNILNYLSTKGFIDTKSNYGDNISLSASGFDYIDKLRENKTYKTIKFINAVYVPPASKMEYGFLFWYNVVDESGTIEEKSIGVFASDILTMTWHFQLDANGIQNFEKVLLQFAKEEITKKIVDRDLNSSETINLVTATQPSKCPYNPENLTETKYMEYEIEINGNSSVVIDQIDKEEPVVNQQSFDYEIFNGVEMKPGVEVYCSDGDSPWYDALGVITSVSKKNNTSYKYEVKFKYSSSDLDSDQIWPCDTNTDEAIVWRMERNLKVFLCHGSEDKSQVREIYQQLKNAEMRPWLDEEDIKPGQEWDTEIRKAIKECHVILVLLSSSSVGKEGYIQREIRFALDRAEEMPEDRIFIIPVRLNDCKLPMRLQKWQRLDLFNSAAKIKLIDLLKDYSKKIALKH